MQQKIFHHEVKNKKIQASTYIYMTFILNLTTIKIKHYNFYI